MRNALLPLYTRMGMRLGMLVTGTLFVENVFNYPGMGRLTYEATMVHDYPVLQGVFLVTALAIVGANVLVDMTYPLVDPRVGRTGGRP
jgi:peptide/nickel transport system permease protein